METSTKPKPMRRERGSLSREEILQAAGQVLEKYGYEGITMRRIATESGCSLASPYVHFKNQSEILQALISQGEADLTRRLREAEAKHADLHQKLSEIAHAYWAFGTNNRELHRLMFSNGERRLYVKKIRYVQPSFRVFLHALRKGTKAGEYLDQRVNPLEIARTLWAWMYGLLNLEYEGLVQITPEDDPVQKGMDLFYEMLTKARILDTSNSRRKPG